MSKRISYVAAATVAMLAGSVAVVASTTAGAETEAIDWKSCPDAKGVECAVLEVPLDWSDPGGKTIQIGLAKRPASHPDERIGSVLVGPGGPGGPGVDIVKEGKVLSDKASERFDTISFDPRGSNSSEQITCDEKLFAQTEKLAANIGGAADFARLRDLNGQLYDDCGKRSGDIVEHADNLQTVEDIEAIRQASGDEKLNFLGGSYGTLMGQQYAQRYPDRIRTMVLDGNKDHSVTDPWQDARKRTAITEENFVEFADWCESTKDCALHGRDVEAVYADLKDRAKTGDLTVPDTGEKVAFSSLTSVALYSSRPQMWSKLGTALASLHSGEGEFPLRLPPGTSPVSDHYDRSAYCADFEFKVDTYEEYKSVRDRLDRKFPNIEGMPGTVWPAQCAGYPVGNDNPQTELDIADGTSLVMIGTIHDVSTPYEWTEAAADQSGANLITYEGWGHTVYGYGRANACIDGAIDRYLIDTTEPGDGMSCPGTEEPA